MSTVLVVRIQACRSQVPGAEEKEEQEVSCQLTLEDALEVPAVFAHHVQELACRMLRGVAETTMVTYLDEDGDVCTLTEHTVRDALSFVELDHEGSRVLTLRAREASKHGKPHVFPVDDRDTGAMKSEVTEGQVEMLTVQLHAIGPGQVWVGYRTREFLLVDILQSPGHVVHVVEELAREMFPEAVAIHATYLDEEADACTLTANTVLDALSCSKDCTGQGGSKVLELSIRATTENKNGKPAQPAKVVRTFRRALSEDHKEVLPAKLAEEARLEKRKYIDEWKRLDRLTREDPAAGVTIVNMHSNSTLHHNQLSYYSGIRVNRAAAFHQNNRDLEKKKGIPYTAQICSQAWEETKVELEIASVKTTISLLYAHPASQESYKKTLKGLENELEKKATQPHYDDQWQAKQADQLVDDKAAAVKMRAEKAEEELREARLETEAVTRREAEHAAEKAFLTARCESLQADASEKLEMLAELIKRLALSEEDLLNLFEKNRCNQTELESTRALCDELREALRIQAAEAKLQAEQAQADKASAEAFASAAEQEVSRLHEKQMQTCAELRKTAEEANHLKAMNEEFRCRLGGEMERCETSRLETKAAQQQVNELSAELLDVKAAERQEAAAARDSTTRVSATVLSSTPLVLGVEASEDEKARGDCSLELAEVVAELGALQAFRMGRVRMNTDACAVPEPACTTVTLVNDGKEPWPDTSVVALVQGDSLGLSLLPLGRMEPGEAAEVVMDLVLPPHTADIALTTRSVWAIVDAVTGKPFGPLLVFEVAWDLP